MMAITILVLFLFGLNQANIVPRTVRVGVVVLLTALIAAYMVVPFALESEYLNASPLLQPEKYASFGIVRIGGWLLTGRPARSRPAAGALGAAADRDRRGGRSAGCARRWWR